MTTQHDDTRKGTYLWRVAGVSRARNVAVPVAALVRAPDHETALRLAVEKHGDIYRDLKVGAPLEDV